jgi:hypothetical protein
VAVIVIEAEEPYVVFFFWRKRFGMQTVRVPVGRVPQIKHTCEGRKIPLLKNACDNVGFRRTNEINPKLTGAKYNKVKKIN